MRGVLFPSAVLNQTVLPHLFVHGLVPDGVWQEQKGTYQTWMVSMPMVPFFGYWRMKKMSTAETATPESSAAERTSVHDVRMQRWREREREGLTVVLCPPGKMTAADDVLEDEPDDRP
jgi:hypothetical protein